MTRWINYIAQILDADSSDLRALALLAAGDPQTFYIGTDISGCDVRGQDLRGMHFGSFDPRTILFDQNTLADDDLLERLRGPDPAADDQVPDPSGDSVARRPGSLLDVLESSDIALVVDGGMARIYRKGRGVILEEPPVYLAREPRLNQGKAVGSAAIAQFSALENSQSGWKLVAPFATGSLSDEAHGAALLRLFFKQALGRTSLRANALVSASAQASPVQRRAVQRAIKRAGASKVASIDRGLAAAAGAGLAVHENRGRMIVDIGASSTEVAVVALSGTVHARTVQAGTATMTADIIEVARRHRGVQLTFDQAEQLRVLHGQVRPENKDNSVRITAPSLRKGEMREVNLPVSTISNAMANSVWQIIDQVKIGLELTPPELANDIDEDGIVLTGPGAAIRGLAEEIRDNTGMLVRIAADPQLCTILGCGKILEHPVWMNAIVSSGER